MHRRPLGRARTLVAIAAVALLAGCLLPWWTIGGDGGLPIRSGNAFDGTGILVFLAAVASLALLTLPYAAERPIGADRWPAYTLLVVLGWIGYVWRVVDLGTSGAFTFHDPSEAFTRMPGLWVVGIALAVLSRAAYDVASEPVSR
ncbi:MAG TPA: hypothetical protein VFC71_07320 [Candidatus Polarisedimenticolia bacterium]|nr:hypothetical protein [Candidatus Polarisedimenticolia bacterium]